MPTYEYICDACEVEFEKFQSITAEPIKVCPECGKKKVRRKISTGAGILFKGGGFYETDYRSKSYNEAKKKDSEASSPAKTETKSDSPAAKAEAPKPAEKPAATEKPAKGKKAS
jgi:putative FmdB family regulatory protein